MIKNVFEKRQNVLVWNLLWKSFPIVNDIISVANKKSSEKCPPGKVAKLGVVLTSSINI